MYLFFEIQHSFATLDHIKMLVLEMLHKPVVTDHLGIK